MFIHTPSKHENNFLFPATFFMFLIILEDKQLHAPKYLFAVKDAGVLLSSLNYLRPRKKFQLVNFCLTIWGKLSPRRLISAKVFPIWCRNACEKFFRVFFAAPSMIKIIQLKCASIQIGFWARVSCSLLQTQISNRIWRLILLLPPPKQLFPACTLISTQEIQSTNLIELRVACRTPQNLGNLQQKIVHWNAIRTVINMFLSSTGKSYCY